jgi:guanosine-3',5'-bis(diphosphate) 3'-pyrophosphohydrolase
MMSIQFHYQEAIKFATYRHLAKKQTVKGTTLPYVVHLSNVAMELFVAALHTFDFDLDYAVQVALLHDTVEDTDTTIGEVSDLFGADIAEGVLALTKNENLPVDEQIPDSLKRTKKLRKEAWAVKLADRITNLQPPPSFWDKSKILNYMEVSKVILDELREGNEYLADRLGKVIDDYAKYVTG